jgi:hypothetical protein
MITYCCADAVKLAGHSCPTVAGAYLMVRRGLRHLYGDDVPQRVALEAYLGGARDRGTTGVVAAIVTLLTGAAPETGFGGIGVHGWFARRDLLHFDATFDGIMALRRTDIMQGVVLGLDATVVPFAREMQTVLPKVMAGQADADKQARFAVLWQARVERKPAVLSRHSPIRRAFNLNRNKHRGRRRRERRHVLLRQPVLAYPLPKKVRIDPVFERKSRYRSARLKAGRDKTLLRGGIVSAAPVPTDKPHPQFPLTFFHNLVSTYFGGHLMHQGTQQQKERGNARLRMIPQTN